MITEHTGGTSPFNSPLNPPENALPPFPLKRLESFIIKEDSPGPNPVHADKKVQDAVKPAMLLVCKEGKEYLIEDAEK